MLVLVFENFLLFIIGVSYVLRTKQAFDIKTSSDVCDG
jgi:hypothetical protein